MKKILALMLILAVVLASALPVCAEEGGGDGISLLQYDGVYRYVQMGEYPHEKDGTVAPVLWKVLAVEDGTVLMLTEKIIDLQQVMFYEIYEPKRKYSYPAVEKYADTDLCKWMNTEMIGTLFHDDPLYNALMEEEDRGKLFCLVSPQLVNSAYGFTMNKDPSGKRVAAPTPYAQHKKLYRDKTINYLQGGSPYWTATQTGTQMFQIVGYDGHLSAGFVHRDNIGVRPAVRLNAELIGIAGGSGTKDDPYILRYTGENPDTEPGPETEP